MVAKYPFQLSTVCSELLKQGISTSKKALKHLLRDIDYSYKRARKSVPKRDETAFKIAQEEIATMTKKRDKNDDEEIYFFDESSFSLTPNIPYGWSPKNETIEINSKRSSALKVLGFLGLNNQLKAYTTKNSVDASHLIEIFNHFVENFMDGKKVTVILDNAPTHTSTKFKTKKLDWEKRGLYLYFLPPYSPQLNRIEMLWKHMKYHWINISDYASTFTLESYINKILKNYGKDYFFEIKFR